MGGFPTSLKFLPGVGLGGGGKFLCISWRGWGSLGNLETPLHGYTIVRQITDETVHTYGLLYDLREYDLGHFLMIVNLYHKHVESRHRLTPELFLPIVCLLDRNLDFGYTYTVFWCVFWLSKVGRRTRLDDYTFFHSPVRPVTFIPLLSHGWIIGWNWYEVSGCQIMHNYQRYG